jgi:transcriptional regulator with XRE-family HTH domain
LRAIFAFAVNPEQIKELRGELRCTARELATTLGVPLAEVQAWESGEQFPTKRWTARMLSLRARGPAGIVRKAPKTKRGPLSPLAQLDNPELWLLLRKLLAHPKLFAQASELAAAFEDPADTAEPER